MSSKSNQFACLQEQDEPVNPNRFITYNKQLTVGELLVFLTKIINLNPDNSNLPVFAVEYGGILELSEVVLEEKNQRVVIE